MKKKVVELFVPVFDVIKEDGTVIPNKQLNPRETYESAKQALTDALLAEYPGSNGQIEKFFVCVEEESILLPPGQGGLQIEGEEKSSIILPSEPNLKLVKS